MSLKQWLLLGLTIEEAIHAINNVVVAEFTAKGVFRTKN